MNNSFPFRFVWAGSQRARKQSACKSQEDSRRQKIKTSSKSPKQAKHTHAQACRPCSTSLKPQRSGYEAKKTWKQVKNIAHISGAAQTELKTALTWTEGRQDCSSKRMDGCRLVAAVSLPLCFTMNSKSNGFHATAQTAGNYRTAYRSCEDWHRDVVCSFIKRLSETAGRLWNMFTPKLKSQPVEQKLKKRMNAHVQLFSASLLA